MSIAKDVGKNIKRMRKTLHITQRLLADKADITVDFLRKIEYGEAPKASVCTLVQIAGALQTDVVFLFSEELSAEDWANVSTVSLDEIRYRVVQNLKYFRKKQGFTQESLEGGIRVSEGCVKRIEEQRICPNISQLVQISDGLGITIQDLIALVTSGEPDDNEESTKELVAIK